MNERGGCMEIREASCSVKRQIIRQHPHTKSFLKRKGILSVAAKAGRLLGFAFVQRRKITTEPRLTEDLILVIEVFSSRALQGDRQRARWAYKRTGCRGGKLSGNRLLCAG